MVTTCGKAIWSCLRDYWGLVVVRAPIQSDRLLLTISGRRRTTEAFGAPLVLDTTALERLNWSFQSAIAVVAGFRAVGIRDSPSSFPTRQLLARCCGAYYQLEIYGTAVAGNIESVELVLFVAASGSRPVVHLIDTDIEAFAADLTEALEVMAGRCTYVDGRSRPS